MSCYIMHVKLKHSLPKKLSLRLEILQAAISHPGLLHPHQVPFQIFVLLRRRDLIPMQKNRTCY
jgi:hypothetical protein